MRQKKAVSFAGSAASAGQFPKGGLPEVAFLGRSNVGKSSLLNALAEVKGLARVSSTPGRTQLVNFFHVTGGALADEAPELLLVDLPGYGYAKVAESVRRSWEKLVVSYLTEREALALCVFLVDARHDPMEGDHALRAFLEHHAQPYVLVATKADKLGRGERQRRLAALRSGFGAGAEAVTSVSAVTRDGVADLWRTLRRAAAGSLEDLTHA
ncbi:MAG TPA: ribosome biogenesis GTP-binding protein YihA/YsxC [Vicinamibacteria bacterium]